MGRSLRIVVADDERDTREFLQVYLSHWGHEVQAVESGRQLVEACRVFLPDLIITDYAMPDLNGWAAVQEVNRSRAVPVILFSGRHDVEHLALAKGSPVLKVLIKPFNQADLGAAVELVISTNKFPADVPSVE
jgi:DNA-binding response OmpR family regulator